MGGAFDSLFCPNRRVFIQNDCPGGESLLPSSRVLGICPRGWLWLKSIPALMDREFTIWTDVSISKAHPSYLS